MRIDAWGDFNMSDGLSRWDYSLFRGCARVVILY